MNAYSEIAEKIIEEQEEIIGPIALEQANRVSGLQIDWATHSISFQGDESAIINNLVEQYKNFFGEASVEVCKAAVKENLSHVPADRVPVLLR